MSLQHLQELNLLNRLSVGLWVFGSKDWILRNIVMLRVFCLCHVPLEHFRFAANLDKIK